MSNKIASGRAVLALIDRCIPFFPSPESARILLLATVAVESEYIERRQAGFSGSPKESHEWAGAWGLAQQEMASIYDGLDMCHRKAKWMEAALKFLPEDLRDLWMTGDARAVALRMTTPEGDPLSILGARLHYLRAPGALPAMCDMDGLWRYYKVQYNSTAGATTRSRFFECWNRLCIPVLQAPNQ